MPRAIWLIVALVLLLLPGYALFGAGQREDPVAAARALIAEGRNDEAIMLLQDTVRRSPQKIEEAERLLSQIRNVRSQYNDLLERLVVHLNQNPGDIVTTLAIIEEMEALDRHPNARIAQQVGLARVIAQLAYDRSVAEGIMTEAAELLQDGRYADAVQRYLDGFDLQRNAFELRDYPDVIGSSVDRAVQQVRQEAARFQQRVDQFESAHQALLQAIGSLAFEGIEGSLELFGDLQAASRQGETLTEEAAETISGHRATVPALFPDDPVDWHMVLLEQFIAGRRSVEQREGILGAQRLIRERQQQRLSVAFEAAREDLENLAQADYSTRRWGDARRHYRDMQELSRFAVAMSVAGSEVQPDVDELELALQNLSETAREVYLLHHAAYRAAETLAEFTVGLQAMDSALQQSAESVEELDLRRVQLADAMDFLSRQRDRWDDSVSRYPLEQPFYPDGAAQVVSRTSEQLEESHAEVRLAEIETVRRIGSLRYHRLREEFQGNRDNYQLALQRIEGIEQTVEDQDDEQARVVYRYPREALAELQDSASRIEELRAGTESLIESLVNEREYVRRDQEVSRTLADARRLLTELESLQVNVAGAIDTAEQRVASANELRARGDQLAAQTEQALAALDVERAGDLWQQAREAYFESLEVQQDEDLREQTDARIVALGVRLQEAENEVIVQRVRELIDQASNLYRQEEYRLARSVLNEARETWARTNVDENPEIERLDRFVSAALVMESRRTLVATEPLYPVLSNYLNLAQNDYDRAQDLIRNNSLAAARPFLSRAEQNLQNVTAVRPYNWEARLLQLEILRTVEADGFDALFRNRVEEAWARRNEDPTDALVDLQALQAINPDYPNLRSRIEQLEISLGIRPDPVTQAQIARSNQLLQQAQNLAAAGGTAQVRAAISILEEAVTLNPDNSGAKVLLDSLRIGSGGQAAVALSSADEQQFRRAETLFVEGNVAQAFAIVERLLQSENNRLYPPLLSLRQRIANRLGI